MDLSLYANPEAASSLKPNGASCDTPLRSWPLARRSGCFPAVPYPPSRSARIVAVSSVDRNVCWFNYTWRSRTPCPARCLRWPVLKWPSLAGFEVTTEAATGIPITS